MNGNGMEDLKKQFLNLKNLISKVITRENIGDEISEDGIVRETEEKTTIDGEGLKVETSIEIRLAGCMHVAKSLDDLGGKCYMCNSVVCKHCFSVCNECGMGVCRRHRFVTEKGEIYCTSCKWKYFLKKFMGFK